MGLNPSVPRVFRAFRAKLYGSPDPSVTRIAKATNDPFRVLASTMISLRTKDEVTTAASERLFAVAPTPWQLAELDEERIVELIYPAGFYRTKAKHLRECARILTSRFDGAVPRTREELTSLPGVGVKTANLTLNLGFGIEAICVDTHVHRISNRLGWIDTKTPEESESALQQVIPKSLWIEINSLFVSYGKSVCAPVSPRCSECPLFDICPKRDVARHR